ncbi:unnamed protein product [Pleuronectes platessa]|uniref:Uncharacterized protein n=1 Tax=Pleuronectes platessa TaxID=8262 RepID=A0A9N7UTP5_PLEPL|nr:unnamed protein product [Pleuronectes platessa]
MFQRTLVGALEAPLLAQLRSLWHQGVANKTLSRASAVASEPSSSLGEVSRMCNSEKTWINGGVRCNSIAGENFTLSLRLDLLIGVSRLMAAPGLARVKRGVYLKH